MQDLPPDTSAARVVGLHPAHLGVNEVAVLLQTLIESSSSLDGEGGERPVALPFRDSLVVAADEQAASRIPSLLAQIDKPEK